MLLKGDYASARCVPPHDITGEEISGHMPEGKGAERLVELMDRSVEVLGSLAVPDGAMIWPWGQGRSPKLEPFIEKFGMRGAVISAVDLVNGLAVLAGMERIRVPGATGFIDTDYGAKGRAAMAALDDHDLVYVHVEAPDEASHMGSIEEKVKALERFDHHVVARRDTGAVRDLR
jgi:2,3-bisphosphoglycerate-independent phosphoglycerate mutase